MIAEHSVYYVFFSKLYVKLERVYYDNILTSIYMYMVHI